MRINGWPMLTLGSPSDHVDRLVVLGERRQILNLAFGAVGFDLPDSHVVVTTSRGETALAVWLKVGRVNRGILIMPIDDERRGFHPDSVVLGRLSDKRHGGASGAAVGGGARHDGCAAASSM